MIDLVTGPPGGGKTYYVVYRIRNLLLTKEKHYRHIFTNINGFNYKHANKLAGESDYCQPFTFDELVEDIHREFVEHEKYKSDPTAYDDYDKYIEETDIFKRFRHSLIVIDECHLYFTNQQDHAYTRFLSYHRHFNIDMILITQNKSLIHKNYLAFIERMIVAQPSAKRFLPFLFRYKVYASHRTYKTDLIGNESLFLKRDVFQLYNSGSTKLGRSALSVFLLPLLFVSFLAFLGFFLFRDSLTHNHDSVSTGVQSDRLSSVSQSDQPQKSEYQTTLHDTDDYELSDDSVYLYATCYSDTCVFEQFPQTFSSVALFRLVSNFHCKPILDDRRSSNVRVYVIACDSSIQSLIDALSPKVEDSDSSGSLLKGG